MKKPKMPCLPFCKMNGAGNDFIIIDNMEQKLARELFPALAGTLCERHLSIGADGFMVVEPPSEKEKADVRMLFFNADGSAGEMCGNGARCICRFAFEKGYAGEIQRIETPSGLVTGRWIGGNRYRIRLTDPTLVKTEYPVTLEDERLECAYVELGTPGLPHAVVPYEGLKTADEGAVRELGRRIRNCSEFPKGANVNFYEIVGEDEIFEKTFERGVEDLTYACGTGTGSVVLILKQKGLVSGRNVRVHVRGGELSVDVEENGLFLTGPTNIVAEGVVMDEAVTDLLGTEA